MQCLAAAEPIVVCVMFHNMAIQKQLPVGLKGEVLEGPWAGNWDDRQQMSRVMLNASDTYDTRATCHAAY